MPKDHLNAMQVGRRRIDFVYEGRDSIEVKMPPPRHMREAALKARPLALAKSTQKFDVYLCRSRLFTSSLVSILSIPFAGVLQDEHC